MGHLTVKVILALLVLRASTVAEDVRPIRTIPTCTDAKVEAKPFRTGRLRYLVPKHAKVSRIKDVDYKEYRVLANAHGKWEALSLFWGVNASPYSVCSAARHQILKLPDGTEGVDARCSSSKNDGKESRSTGFETEYAYYDSVSVESATYFDAIIDSMCYKPQKK